jgi:hypothetical protein
VLGQRFATPEKEEEEEVAELKAIFLDATQGLEADRRYMCQFDTEKNITVMCNEAENELCRLTAQEERRKKKKKKKERKTLTEWLRKRCNYICTIFASLRRQMLEYLETDYNHFHPHPFHSSVTFTISFY